MNEYELLYVVHPRLTADEVATLAEKVSEQVRSAGGEVLGVNHWGKRRLAYPVAHQLEGSYVLMTFNMPPSAAADLERELRLSQQVLRFLLIKGVLGDPAAPAPDDFAARTSRGYTPMPPPQADNVADDPAEPLPVEAEATAGEAGSDAAELESEPGQEPAPEPATATAD